MCPCPLITAKDTRAYNDTKIIEETESIPLRETRDSRRGLTKTKRIQVNKKDQGKQRVRNKRI